MADAVLDASAILALVLEEPGAERVEGFVPGAIASAVNLGEVVAKLRDLGMEAARVAEIVAEMQLDVRDMSSRARCQRVTCARRPGVPACRSPIVPVSRSPKRSVCPRSRSIAPGLHRSDWGASRADPLTTCAKVGSGPPARVMSAAADGHSDPGRGT